MRGLHIILMIVLSLVGKSSWHSPRDDGCSTLPRVYRHQQQPLDEISLIRVNGSVLRLVLISRRSARCSCERHSAGLCHILVMTAARAKTRSVTVEADSIKVSYRPQLTRSFCIARLLVQKRENVYFTQNGYFCFGAPPAPAPRRRISIVRSEGVTESE